MLSRTTFLAIAVAAFGFAAAASAYDSCSPCARTVTVQPTVVRTAPNCATCAAPERTNLPGTYSEDYNYIQSSSQHSSIPLMIPTANGLVETDHIPLTNAVDRYYATHEVVNGRVTETGKGSFLTSAPYRVYQPGELAPNDQLGQAIQVAQPIAVRPTVARPAPVNVPPLSSQVRPNSDLKVTPPSTNTGLRLPGEPVERPVDVLDVIEIAEW